MKPVGVDLAESTKRKTERRPLTETAIKSGGVIKLDKSKADGKVRFPWQRKKKRKLADRQDTLQRMRRVGRVSMIQIGEDEFRMPTRSERRRGGMRRAVASKPVLVQIAGKKGVAQLKEPVPGVQMLEPCESTYLRKAKLRRKTSAEQIAIGRNIDQVHGV